MLYPLKFHPIYKYRLWGGNKLRERLGKSDAPDKTGESWEISGVEDSKSIVSNGALAGNTITELAEIFMGDLLGEKVYVKYGIEFPLLIKLIDANDVLSIQVHPDDGLAAERHNAYGKTEMWYVIQADKGSSLISGFNQKVNKELYLKHFHEGTLTSILNVEKVTPGDAFYIPAGRVHATGAGILFAEIQQTSDITYRIFDWNRLEKDAKPRELHTDLALDAIDFNLCSNYRSDYSTAMNQLNQIVSCQYFETNYLNFNEVLERDYYRLDSFIIYICLGGAFTIIDHQNDKIQVFTGETILIPAIFKDIRLVPNPSATILEVFIPLGIEEDNY